MSILLGLASIDGTYEVDGFIYERGCIPFCGTCEDWHFPCEPHSLISPCVN
jgi:hypothetical protein